MDEPNDLSQLRERFPEWYFGAEWTTAATGPDRRRLWAVKEGTTHTAWSAAALAHDIESAETSE
jgi:hypothetical protein